MRKLLTLTCIAALAITSLKAQLQVTKYKPIRVVSFKGNSKDTLAVDYYQWENNGKTSKITSFAGKPSLKDSSVVKYTYMSKGSNDFIVIRYDYPLTKDYYIDTLTYDVNGNNTEVNFVQGTNNVPTFLTNSREELSYYPNGKLSTRTTKIRSDLTKPFRETKLYTYFIDGSGNYTYGETYDHDDFNNVWTRDYHLDSLDIYKNKFNQIDHAIYVKILPGNQNYVNTRIKTNRDAKGNLIYRSYEASLDSSGSSFLDIGGIYQSFNSRNELTQYRDAQLDYSSADSVITQQDFLYTFDNSKNKITKELLVNFKYPGTYDSTLYIYEYEIGTGIASEAKALTLEVYPNPASGKLFVSNMPISGNIVITDMQGRQVMLGNVAAFRQGIDVSELTNGMYNLQIISSSGVHTARFIKN